MRLDLTKPSVLLALAIAVIASLAGFGAVDAKKQLLQALFVVVAFAALIFAASRCEDSAD